MKNKKALGPVIAISLLVIVSVVAVIGYQSWYTGYQSILFSDTETKSNNGAGNINIEYISNDGIVYISNKNNENKTMDSIKIGDINCNINQELSPGINSISIASCLNESGTNDVVIITDEGIIEKKIFIEEVVEIIVIPTLSFSSNVTGINYDSSINLSWSTKNLDSCTAYGDWSGSKNLNDSLIISNLRTNTTYILNCSGIFGNLSQTIDINITSYPSCLNINSGLAGLWHFDNNANDYSGLNRHMTLYNGLSYSSSGQIGDALGFDGISDYGAISTVNMDSDSWSVSWWMKRTENDYETIFMSASTVSNAIGVDGYPGSPTQNNRFSFESNSNNLFALSPIANKEISDGVWHHLSYVFNSTGSFFYVDGVADETTGARNPDTLVWNFQYVGRGQGGAYGAYFKGHLDDISLWNRPLTPSEISDIYDYGILGYPICDN